MEMKDVIAKWFAWLKQTTSLENEQLAHVYSDGRQIWASDGYSLLALDVAAEKSGRITIGEDATFQVDETSHIPPFDMALPQGELVASVVINAARLKQAAEGQEGLVRLNLYGNNQPLELSSAGKYALVMPATEVPEGWFWRPGKEAS